MLYPRVNAVLLYIVTVCGVADCKVDKVGRDYEGKITLKDRHECLPWDTPMVFEAKRQLDTVMHSFHLEGASSFVHSSSDYCRNKRHPLYPTNDGRAYEAGPWCLYYRSISSHQNLYYTFCGDIIPLCGQYTRCLKLFIYYISLIIAKLCRKVGLIIYTVSQKTSPMFLAITRESIVGFSQYLAEKLPRK